MLLFAYITCCSYIYHMLHTVIHTYIHIYIYAGMFISVHATYIHICCQLRLFTEPRLYFETACIQSGALYATLPLPRVAGRDPLPAYYALFPTIKNALLRLSRYWRPIRPSFATLQREGDRRNILPAATIPRSQKLGRRGEAVRGQYCPVGMMAKGSWQLEIAYASACCCRHIPPRLLATAAYRRRWRFCA